MGLSLSWEKSSQFVNLDFKFTYCVVAPLQSPMAPQNSIFYPWPPSNVPWPPGGPLGPRLGTPDLDSRGYLKKQHSVYNFFSVFKKIEPSFGLRFFLSVLIRIASYTGEEKCR